MAYEWKFNKRPYSDDEAKKLLANVMSPETTDWHYNTHQKGYVTALNNIENSGSLCRKRQLQCYRRIETALQLEPFRCASA